MSDTTAVHQAHTGTWAATLLGERHVYVAPHAAPARYVATHPGAPADPATVDAAEVTALRNELLRLHERRLKLTTEALQLGIEELRLSWRLHDLLEIKETKM